MTQRSGGATAIRMSIDPGLLARAVELSGARTESEAVTIALQQLIAIRIGQSGGGNLTP